MKRSFQASLLAAATAALVVVACGSSRDGFDAEGASPGAGGAPPGSLGTTDAAAPGEPKGIGTLSGTVFAPEGTVPISNALLYLADAMPAPLPSGLTCDKCVQLPAGTPFTYSKADGTFVLPVFAAGSKVLVVQKGHFRRARPLAVAAGDAAIPGELTRLPGAPDVAKGDEIPKIGVTYGGFDKIESSLVKLGITSFDRYGKDPFNDPKNLPPSVGEPFDLLNAPSKLALYNIVLLPCALGGLSCGAPTDAQKDNLRGFVSGGGKLYVTDYSYEYVNQTWPGFITWKDKNGNDLTKNSAWGAGCQDAAYTRPGTANDPALSSWLTAIGETSFDLEDSWTVISKVTPQPGKDPDGNPTTIAPKVWMTSNGTGPSTVSFESQCGRVLFSTYHAEGDVDDALLAQEKALLFILLEVGVCVAAPAPPK
ncbi:MAG: Tryptophan synthase alpha chain [Labilithrix sp.]|nr:Tryptophan synthase alpha chain [Labilithrix sp.]